MRNFWKISQELQDEYLVDVYKDSGKDHGGDGGYGDVGGDDGCGKGVGLMEEMILSFRDFASSRQTNRHWSFWSQVCKEKY